MQPQDRFRLTAGIPVIHSISDEHVWVFLSAHGSIRHSLFPQGANLPWAFIATPANSLQAQVIKIKFKKKKKNQQSPFKKPQIFYKQLLKFKTLSFFSSFSLLWACRICSSNICRHFGRTEGKERRDFLRFVFPSSGNIYYHKEQEN